jgi:hypothetical protein
MKNFPPPRDSIFVIPAKAGIHTRYAERSTTNEQICPDRSRRIGFVFSIPPEQVWRLTEIGFVFLCIRPSKIIKISINSYYDWINDILTILTLVLFFQISHEGTKPRVFISIFNPDLLITTA